MKVLYNLYSRLCKNAVFKRAFVPLYRTLKSILRIPQEKKRYNSLSRALTDRDYNKKRIYYLGSPIHANLGDLAQGVCTREWLKKHYPEYEIVEIKTNCIVNTHFSILKILKECFDENDLIVFQSGYATTDLGGYADDMHCAVMQLLPRAKMLMLPQTIYFEDESRKRRTANIYNNIKRMLFLARDSVSYSMANEMFPDIKVLAYPDIVTTLIGKKDFNYERVGILFCCRDDSEKYYSDKEIAELMDRCSKIASVSRTDTTKYNKEREIITNPEAFIWQEIDDYSHYKLVITDRYHGTIFSLIAGTPVIIIRSTDHKVTTGADWFKGVYDDYVYCAESLEEAYGLAESICGMSLSHKLDPFFETEYYDKLPSLFSEIL